MNDKLLILSIKLRMLLSNEEGQDLIEYALVVSLIAFGAVAAINGLVDRIYIAYTFLDEDLQGAMFHS